jgi:hypothetical protein
MNGLMIRELLRIRPTPTPTQTLRRHRDRCEKGLNVKMTSRTWVLKNRIVAGMSIDEYISRHTDLALSMLGSAAPLPAMEAAG